MFNIFTSSLGSLRESLPPISMNVHSPIRGERSLAFKVHLMVIRRYLRPPFFRIYCAKGLCRPHGSILIYHTRSLPFFCLFHDEEMSALLPVQRIPSTYSSELFTNYGAGPGVQMWIWLHSEKLFDLHDRY